MSQENVADKRWFTNKQVTRIIIGTVVAAGIWYRMEYKYDQTEAKILKKIDEHILSDGYEKKELRTEISQLKSEITKMQYQAEDFVRNEYIRPDEVRPKEERRRR